MKGFIEIPQHNGGPILIAVTAITHVVTSAFNSKLRMVYLNGPTNSENDYYISTGLSYEEIKVLVEQAL